MSPAFREINERISFFIIDFSKVFEVICYAYGCGISQICIKIKINEGPNCYVLLLIKWYFLLFDRHIRFRIYIKLFFFFFQF